MTTPVSYMHSGRARPGARRALLLAAALTFAACHDSSSTAAVIPTTPDPTIDRFDALPGVVVAITGLEGGSGANGNFEVGDFITVTFTLRRNDGEALELSGLSRAGIMVSGPTYNYQRVIASQSDVIATATKLAADTWRYTFPVPIPATYLAPLNDTADLTIGEMTGAALISGTYTVGVELRKDYTTIDGTFRDVGNASKDFIFGEATSLEPREVVTLANCNQCHVKLSAHGGNRTELTNCLLCHTSGAEDRNTASVADGTPGVTIDFKVMIHKIHAGAYLPSVQGVSTRNTGERYYGATPKPYEMIGFGDSLVDFSDIVFPVWPSFYTAMPPDLGTSTLTTAEQAQETAMRKMPVDCSKCHGDPDGDGALPAPAQGDLIYAQPTRMACGSCHDDVVWEQPYTSNATTMPRQLNDLHCKNCHSPEDLVANHTHPLADPAIATGLNISFTSVTDVGGTTDGHFESGEKIQVVFNVTNDDGDPVDASAFTRMEFTLNGPTENPQFINYGRIPLGAASLSGSGPYTMNVPQIVFLDPIGTSNGSLNTFNASRTPVWNVTTGTDPAPTSLLLRTGVTASTTMSATAEAAQNYIDVASATGISNGSYIVIADATLGSREYMRVQWVDGTRLWFGTAYTTNVNYKPSLLVAHALGTTVDVVSLSAVSSSDYTVDSESGLITETSEFGAGEVVANYWSDFVVPDFYPGSIYNTIDQGQDYGDWQGLALLDGTYRLDLHGRNTVVADPTGQLPTNYTQGAHSAVSYMLFGAAATVDLPARVEGAAACNRCHVDIQFHGGSRRGYDSCIGCHGTAAVEDSPQYTGSHTQAQTPTFTAEFRVILHELHEGVFPAMPGGTAECAACHGADNDAWKTPASRLHPSQADPTRAWGLACGSCHSDTGAQNHIASATNTNGTETCATCHGEGEIRPTEFLHRVR